MLQAIETAAQDAPQREIMSLDRMTWEYIQRTVQECDGNLSEAARVLGIDRNTVRRRLTRSPSKE
jgi:two-component system response regulator RegA